MCNFKKIILTTTSFVSLKKAYPDNLKILENSYYRELFFDESKNKYFNSDTDSVSYIQLNNIFIFPSIDNIPPKGFLADKLLSMLDFTSKNSLSTLFILHRSDIGFGNEYMEKLLIEDDLKYNKYCHSASLIKNNVIVFQHDDGSSPNIYRDIILNSMISEKLDAEKLYAVIMDKYQLLYKPWALLIKLRDDLIMGKIFNPELYPSMNLESQFGLDLRNISREEQIYKIEKCITYSPIRQIK